MKKIAIMQPYFFPYIGYFGLIKHTDSFIIFDTVNFITHGWIERNRILKQSGGWLYIKVPLKNSSRNVVIKDLIVDAAQPWKKKMISQLDPYKKIAPYYREVIAIFEDAVEENAESIVKINKKTLESVCSYLGIDKPLKVFSEMNLAIEKAQAPDEWALNICKALGDVSEYWNPPGGQDFFDKTKYQNAGIELKFHKQNLKAYNQKRPEFEAGLSIIDAIMFNSPEEINAMLDDYELI